MLRSRPLFLLLALAVGCGPSPVPGKDGGDLEPDAGDASAPPEARCIDEDGADLGPLDPPVDACALADSNPDDAVAAAACLAIGPFERGEFTYPNDLLLGDVTARRFGLEALRSLWPLYELELLEMPSRELRLYARIADLTARVSAEDLEGLTSVDAVTMPALHCLYHPLPAGYADRMIDALALGGYESTHVTLALMWFDDLGCPSPVDAAFYEEALTTTASFIDDDHAITNDLEIESAAFLAYLGESDRIPAGFLEGVIQNQQPEGGWGGFMPDDPPNGHTSGLALWYLHEVLSPGRVAMPMVTRCLRED
jgi:hypothetical protein